MNYQTISLNLANELTSRFQDKIEAILLTGSAARGEFSSSAQAQFSDLDFLVVLRETNPILSVFEEKKIRRFTKTLEEKMKAIGLEISIGFANAYPNHWRMATPFMWELRENALLLQGNPRVVDWPVIHTSDQIPAWEGARLLANRLCEFFGSLAQNSNDPENSSSYSLIKLAIACSECLLISSGQYQSTYAQRQAAHMQIRSAFTAEENSLIDLAYKAKLSSQFDAFWDDQEMINTVFKMVLHTFDYLGLNTRRDWTEFLNSKGFSWNDIYSNLSYFLNNLATGQIVRFHHAITDTYLKSVSLAKEIVLGKSIQSSPSLVERARNIYLEYKRVPQIVSVVIEPSWRIPWKF